MINEIEFNSFKDGDVYELAGVVASAMCTNPLHKAIFGSDEPSKRMQVKLFAKLLSLPQCNITVAKHNGNIVGVMNYYLPGKCQLSTAKTISMLPWLLPLLGTRLPAVLKWKTAWARHDPKVTHLHFGPLAVIPSMQNQGIGYGLLTRFCGIADARKNYAYLETDKEENLLLYQRFGFRAVQTDIVCGVKNWFMWREPAKLKDMIALH